MCVQTTEALFSTFLLGFHPPPSPAAAVQGSESHRQSLRAEPTCLQAKEVSASDTSAGVDAAQEQPSTQDLGEESGAAGRETLLWGSDTAAAHMASAALPETPALNTTGQLQGMGRLQQELCSESDFTRWFYKQWQDFRWEAGSNLSPVCSVYTAGGRRPALHTLCPDFQCLREHSPPRLPTLFKNIHVSPLLFLSHHNAGPTLRSKSGNLGTAFL